MTKPCRSCDATGQRFIQGIPSWGDDPCRECGGTGEVEVTCEWCGKALERGEVDICDSCAAEYDRQDTAERLSCEFCPAVGGGCVVCGGEHGSDNARQRTPRRDQANAVRGPHASAGRSPVADRAAGDTAGAVAAAVVPAAAAARTRDV